MSVPTIGKCETTSCSFNHGGCNAFAMTMGQSGCVTFIEIGRHVPADNEAAKVGACQRADCTYNHDLECSANKVEVGADGAECLTYAKSA
ncbi:MAG: hypothetical protein Q4B12_00800 [Bowdeniella nasicola]|nr:hypothetical protein [Bowdeniella nasicola]